MSIPKQPKEQESKEEVRRREQSIMDLKTVIEKQEVVIHSDAILINLLYKKNIALKLEIGKPLNNGEIDFLKKNCMK